MTKVLTMADLLVAWEWLNDYEANRGECPFPVELFSKIAGHKQLWKDLDDDF